MEQVSSIKRISEYKSVYIPDAILEDMKLDSGDNVVWFRNDDGQYLIKKVQVDILDQSMGDLLKGFVSLVEGEDDLLSIAELMNEEETDDWALLVKCFSELHVSTVAKDLKRINKFYNLKRWQELSIMALIKLMEIMVKETEELNPEMAEAMGKINSVHPIRDEYDGSMFG